MPRRLGQHYLINKAAIRKIIDALELESGDVIIEIGPGTGALTRPLLRECQKLNCKLIAIEKDPKLGFRVEGLGDRKKLKVIVGDALKILPQITKPYALTPIPYKIVGNIPYYITGRLLRVLSELKRKPKLIVLTIQKEVAERIVAHPPKMNPTHRKCSMCGMNLLSAITQFWAEPEIIARLGPKDFSPPPKVDSAIIKLATKKISNYQLLSLREISRRETISNYYRFVKILFKQPRKTIFNNLRAGLKIGDHKILNFLGRSGLAGQERPGNLELAQIIDLSRLFFKDL